MTLAELRALVTNATPSVSGGLVARDEEDLFAAWEALPVLLDVVDRAVALRNEIVTSKSLDTNYEINPRLYELDCAIDKLGSKEPTR